MNHSRKGSVPQIIFHGAEPLLNSDAVFAGIEAYENDFRFGIQTNAVLLDDAAIEFLTSRMSASAFPSMPPRPDCRPDPAELGRPGIFKEVVAAMGRLKGYENWSVICTITAGICGN